MSLLETQKLGPANDTKLALPPVGESPNRADKEKIVVARCRNQHVRHGEPRSVSNETLIGLCPGQAIVRYRFCAFKSLIASRNSAARS